VDRSVPATLVALLRGINVGRARRVAMADLRALIEGLGYRSAHTLLNSGNAVFTAKDAPAKVGLRIEKALVAKLGVSSRVTVLTGAELAAVVKDDPIGRKVTNPSRYLVAFLAGETERTKLRPLAKQDWGKERLALGRRVAYLWCPEGFLESPMQAAVAKALGDAVTVRNWATTTKLEALAQSLSPASGRRSRR
jgi:uncharacterized protein (DUF1697 family)